MRYKARKLIEELCAQFPDKDPQVIKQVVNSYWAFARKTIESGSFETVLMKYFGRFTVFQRKALSVLRETRKGNKAFGKTPEERRTMELNLLKRLYGQNKYKEYDTHHAQNGIQGSSEREVSEE